MLTSISLAARPAGAVGGRRANARPAVAARAAKGKGGSKKGAPEGVPPGDGEQTDALFF
jgi:hypothetical protein